MAGIFQLATGADLREKLRRDLAKFKASPLDADLAFNVFVTAEHMLDWVYPKKTNKLKRTNERKNSILLRICSHLANGAKHFEVEDPQHNTVSGSDQVGGYFPSSYFGASYFAPSYFGGSNLVVRLKGDAEVQFGKVIGAIELAEKVMEFWDKHPLK